jgi:hypothetical protein
MLGDASWTLGDGSCTLGGGSWTLGDGSDTIRLCRTGGGWAISSDRLGLEDNRGGRRGSGARASGKALARAEGAVGTAARISSDRL